MQALRAAWPERLAGVAARDLVFIDESGCNRAMTRTHARSLAGTRAFASAPRNWGDNVSIISALAINGPLATLHLPGAVNGEAFLLYVREVLCPKLWPGAVVVLDNLGAHRAKAVRAQLAAVGARLEYLPPYSPDLNPIELAWSKLKSFLRKAAARTTETLYAAIAAGLLTLSASNAEGWFKHCGYQG